MYITCIYMHMPYVHRAKKREVEALGEQVDLFTEAVAAKDHVVVELTNKVIHDYRLWVVL